MEGLSPLHRRVAGIDVHRLLHVVTVLMEANTGGVRSFVFPQRRLELATWPKHRRGQVFCFSPAPFRIGNMARPLRLEFSGALYHVTAGKRKDPCALFRRPYLQQSRCCWRAKAHSPRGFR